MKSVKVCVAIVLALVLSACASGENINRSTPIDTTSEVDLNQKPTYTVKAINVTVPRSLSVSEANSYLPKSDIVWRGDPLGDRYEQIEAIFDTALARGTKDMKGLVPVILDVEVLRFHALTEKTRYSVGGVHSIKFALSLRNAETGLAMGEKRIVEADLQGYGGQQALEADAAGQTQKVRITAHLANVIRAELERPGGYENENLGVIQALNRF